MPTIKVKGIKIYYERKGAGNPVLLISGIGGDHLNWAPVVERLKDRYECISFDCRGIGLSSRPKTGYTIPDLTRDALGLLDALSISRVHVIGQSMGGMIAQSMALQRPKLVCSLIFLASLAASDSRANHALHSRIAMMKYMTRYEYFWATAAWFFSLESLSKPDYIEKWAKKASSKPNPQSVNAFSQLADAVAKFDGRGQLNKIRQPTLVMVGEQDILTPPYMSRILADGIPGAKLVVFPGRGHQALLEDTNAVVGRMKSFLNRVDAG